MLKGKIVSRDGRLFVLYETALENEPTIKFIWWAIESTAGNPYHCSRPLEGDTVTYRGNGQWSAHNSDNQSTGSVYTGAGDSEAAHVEYVSAPAPKTRGKEARWYQGRWEKLLKRGWVPA